ncbi:MAG: hypothetical protein DBX59_02035 [Bacillota bacterium]|nr:MAG: hypothetical protein DBX59_02035 [Bacillota bacterium]
MNPFNEKPQPIEKAFESWKKSYPVAYDKNETDPYTKTRIILMNGTEFEANWCSHEFARQVADNDLKRDLALVRAAEKRQQLKHSLLKPVDETVLEHTIGYEQLAVDLTAELAKRTSDRYVKKALDFALLEDFDHLYRYADVLEWEQGVPAERLVGNYTEIMPGRPTIAHHRFPTDNVKRGLDANADLFTNLATMIITAAEQQTMNYYMNVSAFANTESARKLYQEIALVEEEHVTQYESLMNPDLTWTEMLLWHEYAECYLYWSCYMTETHPRIKDYWEENLRFEISHLHKAAELLKKYDKKEWRQVIANGDFPEPLSLHENIEYVRSVLKNTVQFTASGEEYEKVEKLEKNAPFFSFQKKINPAPKDTPSHMVIDAYIRKNGKDYRWSVKPNPVKELQCATEDNTDVGRVPDAAKSTSFESIKCV